MAGASESRDRRVGTTPRSIDGIVWDDHDSRAELIGQSVQEYVRYFLGDSSNADEARKLLSEALLVVTIEQIGVHGELPMPRAKFHQIVSERFELPAPGTRPNEAEFSDRLKELLLLAEGEEFQDGHENEFSRELVRVVCHAGPGAVTFVGDLILKCEVDDGVAAVALETFGEMWDHLSRDERRRVLEECLESSSATVRNGAVIGLANLSDPRSVDALEKGARIR